MRRMTKRPETMLAALAWACRKERRARKVPRWRVARRAGVGEATVVRFEQARAWPRDVDHLVDIYAKCTGAEPRDLWEAAFHAWRA